MIVKIALAAAVLTGIITIAIVIAAAKLDAKLSKVAERCERRIK